MRQGTVPEVKKTVRSIPCLRAFGQLTVEFLIQAIASSGEKIKDHGVTDQAHHVASPDQYRRTTFAAFEMLVHPSAQGGTDHILQVIRDLAPHLVATDLHCLGPCFLPQRLVFHLTSVRDLRTLLSEAISQRFGLSRRSLPTNEAIPSLPENAT